MSARNTRFRAVAEINAKIIDNGVVVVIVAKKHRPCATVLQNSVKESDLGALNTKRLAYCTATDRGVLFVRPHRVLHFL